MAPKMKLGAAWSEPKEASALKVLLAAPQGERATEKRRKVRSFHNIVF